MHAFTLNTRLFAVIALGLLATQMALAAPPVKIQVTNASPDSALQGETLDVVVSGSGFGPGATVRYLVGGTKDDSQINVNSVAYNADGTLTTNIQIAAGALVSDYDIEVQSLSGRRGKGTTLFAVLFNENNAGGRNNPDTISCDELFGFPELTCTAKGTLDPCMFKKPIDSERSWVMMQDCDTRAMLVVSGDEPFLSGDGFELNLVAPWSGEYAGVSNVQGASRIAGFRVRVGDPAVANGCGGIGTVQAAVHFDPDLPPQSGAPRGSVNQITVETSNGARFCYGIDFFGSNPVIAAPYKGTHADRNRILANSYERVGIRIANVNNGDKDTKPGEEGRFNENYVEPTDVPCAIGMLLDNVERPEVTDNVVMASSGAGCAFNTAGIVITDSGRNKAGDGGSDYDFLEARPADLYGNVIMTGGDGSIGIVIDGDTTAEMSSSDISAFEASDIGVCVETGGDFSEVRKASTYSGFASGNETQMTADCNVLLP